MPDSIRSTSNPVGASVQISEIHILWITAGLGCDGDTVAITAATQPSLEDLVLGVLPGLPAVHFHNPVLAYANGQEFLKTFSLAGEGKLEPFILVVEGSIPNETIKSEGFLGRLWHRPRDRSADYDLRMD